MIETILFALWFFLPAGIANASPVIANKIPLLNQWTTSLDFGATLRNKRVFGKNKTWRGLVAGIATATLVVALQKLIYSQSNQLQEVIWQIDYQTVSLWLGPLLGAGALIGDALESFFKRQIGVESGEPWFPFDQIDYIIGGIVFSAIVVPLSLTYYLAILIVWFGMHLLWSYIGFVLNLKDKPI